jgi:predicted nucleotidyltransferase
MKPDLNDIKNIIGQQKNLLIERYKVKEIGIFGSYIRNEQKPDSDLDILVDFIEPISLLKLVNMENYLNEIIGIKTDVIPKPDLRPELREDILNETVFL